MLYLISDVFRTDAVPIAKVPTIGPPQTNVTLRRDSLPHADELSGSDTFLVAGPINDQDVAFQLGGILRLAVEKGATVIIAYPVTLTEGIARLTFRLLEGGSLVGDARRSGNQSRAKHEAFRDYLTAYAQAQSGFETLPSAAETLAVADLYDGAGFVERPVGIVVPLGAGHVYVLPYHRPAALPNVLPALLRAVEAHQAGADEPVAEFLESLRLPGEDDLQTTIDGLARDLKTNRGALKELARFKNLVGKATGTPFENLAIESLNRIFQESDYRAEDRDEKFKEDFWILKQDEDFALVEAKGINSGIGRAEINQVDDHREALGRGHEFPGLLIVNVFRLSDELGSRQETIHPDIVSHAKRQNVLSLRSWDLYGLLNMTLSGEKPAKKFLDGLRGGGGWLEVADGKITHHTE